MPATATPLEPTASKTPAPPADTRMSSELKAKTDAAISQITNAGVNDPEFDSGLQAAMDRDAGKEPASTKEEAKTADSADQDSVTEKPVKKTEPAVIADDIPPELLGEKPKEQKQQDAGEESDEDRQKFIAEQTKGMTPKAADRFKKIEARAYEAERKAKQLAEEREKDKADLQKQLSELNQKIAATKETPQESEAYKKRIAELEEVVGRAAIQEDPRFKAAYDGRIESEISLVKKMVPADTADELGDLMALPESKKRNERILEIAETLDALLKTKVLQSVAGVDRISRDKSSELAKWRENKVHVEAEELRKREVEQARLADIHKVAWTKGMESVSGPETGLEVFRKIHGNDEWNNKVDSRIGEVQKLLTNPNIPPEQIVQLAAKSVAADEYRRMFLAQRMLVKKLNDELESLKTSEPKADKTGAASIEPDNDDFITATTKGALAAGGLVR